MVTTLNTEHARMKTMENVMIDRVAKIQGTD